MSCSSLGRRGAGGWRGERRPVTVRVGCPASTPVTGPRTMTTRRFAGGHACSSLHRTPPHRGRRPARPGHRRADRRRRPRRARLRLRLGPLVLPRRLAVRAGPDRPRVHRRRRGRRRRRRGRHSGRPRDRAVRLQRRHVPALPPRHHLACVARRLLPGQRRRRPGRGGPRAARRRHAGPGARLRALRRDARARC